jgi:hypothetical protein
MTILKALASALLGGAIMTGSAFAHEPLCPIDSTEATTAEQNLMAAVARVFMARWLRFATAATRNDPNSGAHLVLGGADCADLTINTGERFKLYRIDKTPIYQLDTASGEMLGQISFDRLSESYFVQYDSAYILIHGLPGAVCDGSAILKMKVWQAPYAPGRCRHDYASVGDNAAPARVIAAMRYIFANLTRPAEVPHDF